MTIDEIIESKSILPKVTGLKELLNNSVFYSIPAYQRPYEWDVNEVNELYEQIIMDCESEKETYLGTIQLNTTKDGKIEIIDGQQRLITLYIFLRVLGIDSEMGFNLEYHNEDLAEGLTNLEFGNSKYSENYNSIKNKIETLDEKDRDKYKICLKEHLLNRVIIFSINTCFDDLDKTVKIFDSLNTMGRPLEKKDLFKNKFVGYLELNNETYKRINEAYSCIRECQYLDENDLMDTFRFCLLAESKEELTANQIKESNMTFFERMFKSKCNDKDEVLTLFCDIAEFMKNINNTSTYEIEHTEIYCMFAQELLAWSGYYNLRNIFYAIAFLINGKKTIASTEAKVMALRIANLLWKYCAIYHSVVGQTVKHVYCFIGNNVLKYVYTNNDQVNLGVIRDKMKEDIRCQDRWKLKEGFNDILDNKVMINPRRYLFLAISFIDDEFKTEGEKIMHYKNCISLLFHPDKWNLDIEHIISAKFISDFTKGNGIGNLMYLEKNISKRQTIRLS